MNTTGSPAPSNERIARVAAGVLIGVLGAVILTASDLSPRLGLLRWAVYIIVSGIVINNQAGLPFRWLTVASLAGALSMMLSLMWLIMINCSGKLEHTPGPFAGALYISNANVCGADAAFDAAFLFIIFAATNVGMIVACYARPMILGGLQRAGVSTANAQLWEGLLNKAVTIVGLVWMLLQKFAA